MISTRSKIVSVASKAAAPVQVQTWTSNVSAKIVDRTLDDQGPVERQDRDSYSVTALADITDRSLHAAFARFTGGLSPAAIGSAYLDWVVHLAVAPGKRLQLVDKSARKAIRFVNYAIRYAMAGGQTECCIEPLPQDRRFIGEGWQRWPFNFISQAVL